MYHNIQYTGNFPDGSDGKESTCNVGDLGSIPGLGRSPGEGNGYPLQYSGLDNFMDCIVHRVAKSWTRLSDFRFVRHAWSSATCQGLVNIPSIRWKEEHEWCLCNRLKVLARRKRWGCSMSSSPVTVVPLLSCVCLFATPWTTAHQASLCFHSLLEFAQIHVHCVGDAIPTNLAS